MAFPLSKPQSPRLKTAAHSLPAALTPLLPAWRRLETNTIVPAVAASPAWLAPMMQHVTTPGDQVQVLTVSDEAHLTGVFPLQRLTRRWGIPVPVMSTWITPFSFSGTPMIAADCAPETVAAVLTGIDDHCAARGLLLQYVPSTGRFFDTISAATDQLNVRFEVFEPYERASLTATGDYETWLAGAISKKRRKEYRRVHRQLAECGKLTCKTYQSGEPLQPWIDDFLKLESAGWKGRGGTAMASSEAMTCFINQALPTLNNAGQLRFWKIALDGKTIAILFAMITGKTAWLGKMAYAENLARYSPGVLLILNATRDLIADDTIAFADSCAVPNHPMIDHIWRDRIAMCDMLIATPGTSAAQFALMVWAERNRRALRNTAKSVYHRYLKTSAK